MRDYDSECGKRRAERRARRFDRHEAATFTAYPPRAREIPGSPELVIQLWKRRRRKKLAAE